MKTLAPLAPGAQVARDPFGASTAHLLGVHVVSEPERPAGVHLEGERNVDRTPGRETTQRERNSQCAVETATRRRDDRGVDGQVLHGDISATGDRDHAAGGPRVDHPQIRAASRLLGDTEEWGTIGLAQQLATGSVENQ